MRLIHIIIKKRCLFLLVTIHNHVRFVLKVSSSIMLMISAR